MKARYFIILSGCLLGLGLKWGTQHFSEAHAPAPIDPSATVQAPVEPEDPLVPPLKIPGLLPPVANDPQPFLLHDHLLGSPFQHDVRAMFHAHGEQICASGCAASHHPTGDLTKSQFRRLLKQYAVQPMTENSLALETLLYFGRQTADMLDDLDVLPLDSRRANFLAQQLAYTHAKVSIRVVDEEGQLRASLPPTSVPFDRRHVFDMDTQNVQPLVTSGTVKRVGLYHLWTRL